MERKKVLITILVLLLAISLIYGLLRVILGRQRRVNLDASLKYANILVEDLKDTCTLTSVEDEKAIYNDYATVNCYFSSDKSEYNKAAIEVDSNGSISRITYYLKADTHRPRQYNIDKLNVNMSKLSSSLFTTRLTIRYGDFININTLPDSSKHILGNIDYNKNYHVHENGNESNSLYLDYTKKPNDGLSLIKYTIG